MTVQEEPDRGVLRDALATWIIEGRSSVTSIQGYSALLLKGHENTLTDQQHKAISTINQQSQRVMILWRCMLDYSRAQYGSYTIEHLSIPALVDTVVAQLTPYQIQTVVDAQVSLQRIRGDGNHLIVAFSHLLYPFELWTPNPCERGSLHVTLDLDAVAVIVTRGLSRIGTGSLISENV